MGLDTCNEFYELKTQVLLILQETECYGESGNRQLLSLNSLSLPICLKFC